MKKKILPSAPNAKVSPETREFLADFHNFTNKWPTQRIAKLPEINLTRQAIYMNAKKVRGEESK